MTPDLLPGVLRWDEVDPARHPFDAASAAEVVRSLGPARQVPRRPEVSFADRVMSEWSWNEGRLWGDAMSHALVERYGLWAAGWRWALDEGDFDGGPVGSWCCPMHSMATPEETLDRVVAGLCEWRDWLETLARWFEAYPLELTAVEDQRILWERAARNIILQVTDRTGCGSGWYGHCHQVLSWFLSRWGVPPDLARELVEEAVGGRFKSWSGPDPVLVDDIAEKLALSLRPDDGAAPSDALPDHLERWLAVRDEAPWHEVPDSRADGDEPVIPFRDGAAEDIRAFDGSVDAARAAGLLAALEALRADAARGAPLDFATIRRWQQHVLGGERLPPFRTEPAFAKRGRERYGIGPDTRARLDACLAQSAADDARPMSLPARAARAYLDVCFFHPFDDGNARAAFLTLVFVLPREGVVLDKVSLLRRHSFRADAPRDAVALTRYVDLHMKETRRRAVAPTAVSP
ncbi:Fic family protein [Streptomyces sp. NPDC051976]|uniref:Fic family protein n=1 Tax=Streptomyces sp. NPDC051976 TaxID=3154947 RepID=UPI00342DEA31